MAGKGKMRKRNGKRKNRGMTKGLKNAVTKIAKEAVEEFKETKYISNALDSYTNFTPSSTEVDVSGERFLYKIPLAIPNGDDYKSRDGDKVMLKTLILRMRGKPQFHDSQTPIGTNPGTANFQKQTVLFHVLRIDKNSVPSVADLDVCIRRPQEIWSDSRQSSGRAVRKSFTIVAKFELPLRYRDCCSLNPETIPPEMCVMRYPQTTFLTKRIKLDKVTKFSGASSNEPVQYDYYLYGTWGRWNRDAYSAEVFPNDLQIWRTWLFKDM